jgi:O-antigen/teichoic acid export membrane protein
LGLKIGANFIMIPIALRFLGREDYAVWIIFQSIAVYLTLAEFGVGQSVVNFQNIAYAKGDYRTVNQVLTTTFGLNWLVVIPMWALCALIILGFPVERWFLKDVSVGAAAGFKALFFLTGTLALFRVPLMALSATLVGVRELVLRQIIEAGYAIFPLIGAVLTLVLGGKVLALILVTNLVLISITALSYPLVRSRHSEVRLASSFWNPALVRPLFANSAFFFLYNLGMLFQRLAGSLLAAKFGTLRQVPEMFVLLTLLRVVGWSLADIVSQTLLPYINRLWVLGQRDRVVFYAKLCTKFTFALALTYSAAVWLLANVGIRIWLGPGMFLGYGPLACLTCSFLVDVLFLPTNNFLRCLNRHRQLALVMAGYAVLSFGFGIVGAKWLIPADPLYGLTAGMLLASILGQAVPLPWIALGGLEIGWRRYFRQFIVLPALLAVCGMALVLSISYAGPTALWQSGLGAISIAFVLSLLTWFVVFDKEERDGIYSLIGRLKLGVDSVLEEGLP